LVEGVRALTRAPEPLHAHSRHDRISLSGSAAPAAPDPSQGKAASRKPALISAATARRPPQHPLIQPSTGLGKSPRKAMKTKLLQIDLDRERRGWIQWARSSPAARVRHGRLTTPYH